MNPDLKRVQYEFGIASDPGRKRRDSPNQDAAAVVLPGSDESWHPPLLLVADGLGRYSGGELASQTVVDVFAQEFKESLHPADYPALLERCARSAHQKMRALGAGNVDLSLMGSTIVAVTLERDRLLLLNVGDSRGYLLESGTIRQVSRDHSWIAAQVRAGTLSEAEARVHPDRNRLTMAITAKREKVEFHLAEEKLTPQNVILLCSDGLWSVVPETLIHAVAMELPPQAAADKLVRMANTSRGPDNISVVIARRVHPEGSNREPGRDDTLL